MTLPAATVLLDCVVTVPSRIHFRRTRPWPLIAVMAAACVIPTTFGTETIAGPLDTTRFTADPTFKDVPAMGPWPMTLPVATVSLDWTATAPRTRPAPVAAVAAAASVIPTMFGTETLSRFSCLAGAVITGTGRTAARVVAGLAAKRCATVCIADANASAC